MPKNFNSKNYLVSKNNPIDLKHAKTIIRPCYNGEKHFKGQLKVFREKLIHNQQILFAIGKYSILIIFQGMDTSGKDGAIKHIMSGVNPQGCDVYSFKQPTDEEVRHDFLWRSYRNLPPKGKIGIFNRSYYEEVVAVRIHREFLLREKIPAKSMKSAHHNWKMRFKAINAMEEHLYRSGTEIIKIFFHLSKDEQRKRLLARIDDSEKNWKFSENDFTERKYWPEYMKAYSVCLNETNTKYAPWYVVPADDKQNARLITSKIIDDHIQRLKLKYPVLGSKQRKRLKKLRALIEKD